MFVREYFSNMKKNCLILLLLIATSGCYPQHKAPESAFGIKQLLRLPWNSPDGLPYREGPGANLGATSFEVLDNGQIAFLSNASNEIIIVDVAGGKVTKRFTVNYAPRDFACEGNRFYVLTDFQVNVYDGDGQAMQTIDFPVTCVGVERMTRSQGSTYLLLPNGNSLLIESHGRPVEPEEIQGWMTGKGSSVSIRTNGNASCSVTRIDPDGKRHERSLSTGRKIAGVFVVGTSGSRVFLDVQTYILENPIRVQRKIMSLEMAGGKADTPPEEFIVPDVYYVLSNKDFSVSGDGVLYQMITAPEGLFIFSLTGSASGDGYPDFLRNRTYHFNDHLINVDDHEN
jgi:hypothetical protein